MASQRLWHSTMIALVVFASVFALSIPAATYSQEKKCEVKNSPKEKQKTGKEFKEGAPCGGGLGKCKDDKCEIQGDGKMPMLPMLPMLPMPMPMPPPPPDMPMNCGASTVGNSVGGVFRAEGATTSTTTKDQNCPNSNNPYWDQTGSSQQNVSSNTNGNSNTGAIQNTAAQSVSDLFHDLFGDGSDFNSNNGSSSTNVVKPTPAPTSTPRATPFVGNPGLIEVNPGVSGNIEFHDKGATIHITRETGGTTVAGFYGSDSAAAPTGLVQTWCASRPWATNFLSRIIPSGFFDGLCTLRGYAVGIVPRSPNASRAPGVEVPRQQQTVTSFTSNPIQPVAKPKPVIPAGRADIWAVPSSVRLGSRATVFWNAIGVTSCEETSPEGGFTHNTISGGAETVAISGPTTFSISCVTQAGAHITNYTTVNLAN